MFINQVHILGSENPPKFTDLQMYMYFLITIF